MDLDLRQRFNILLYHAPYRTRLFKEFLGQFVFLTDCDSIGGIDENCPSRFRLARRRTDLERGLGMGLAIDRTDGTFPRSGYLSDRKESRSRF
jgi:hypothetical protein